MKKILFPSLAIILSIISLISILELTARVAVYLNVIETTIQPPENKLGTKFRLTEPAPYQNSLYYDDFVKNTNMGFRKKERKISGKDTFMVMADRDEKYITIKNNIRRTSYHQPNPKHDIFLFGGSTVVCREVPDSLTIASYLQKLINENGNSFNVYNLGVSGGTVENQFKRLKNTPLKKGDLVIFYDGVNDSGKSYLEFRRSLTNNQPNFLIKRLSKFKSFLYNNFLNHLEIVRVIWYLESRSAPSVSQNELQLFEGINQRYFNYIKASKQLTDSLGGEFYHFLQPTLFTKKQYSDYEQQLINTRMKPHNKQVIHANYRSLENTSDSLNKLDLRSTNLTHAFDTVTREIYLDAAHVTEHANKVIAINIFDKIRPTLKEH